MRQDSNDPTTPTMDPPVARPDMDLPGAERPEPQEDPKDELPQKLGQRSEHVEVPNAQM